MGSFLRRYAFGVVLLVYASLLSALHAGNVFPRASLYELSRLVGGSYTTLEGRILDTPTLRWHQTRFLLQAKADPLSAFHGRVLVTLNFPAPDLAPGDHIRIGGWLSHPRLPRSEEDFDERSYWATRKVFALCKVWSPDSLTVLKRSSRWSLKRLAWTFHQHYREFWERALPPSEAALLLGVTLGARGVLPRDLKEACIRAGVYHIVVVSGQNMSLIVALGVGLLLMLQVAKRRAFWICAVPIVFYATAVGGDPPVVRAAAMALIGLFAAALGRDIPRYYPLFLAAGWILLWEPEALFGASFQLSFGATLSILAMVPLWEHTARSNSRWGRRLKEAGLMGIMVHLGIWPLLVYYFHRLSFAGLIANWTIFPLSGLLMVLGLTVGTIGVLAPRTIPGCFIGFTRLFVHAMLLFINRMAGWSWSVRHIAPPPAWVFALYYGALFGILFYIHSRKIYGKTIPIPSANRPRL